MTLTLFCLLSFLQAVQITFMAEKWVDHSLDMARKAKKGQEAAKKAWAKVEKKLKETFTQLSEMEKDLRNAKSALKGYERLSQWWS